MKGFSSKQIILLIGCMLIQAIPYGLAQNVPPLYISPLTTVYHFNLSSVGFLFTIGAIFAAAVSPIAGKFFGKIQTKILMLSGLAVSAVGMFLQVTGNSIFMFYVANCLIQAGCIVFSGLAVPYLLGSWFDESNRATAMGIAFSGGSIGNFFLQPIFTNLFLNAMNQAKSDPTIGLHACKQVFFIIFVAFIVLGLLIILLFIRENKQDKTPNQNYDEQMSEVLEQGPKAVKGCGFTKTKSLSSFWLMGVAMLIIGLNIAAQAAQYNAFFNYIHLNEVIGDTLFGFIGSAFAVGCLFGNVVGGVLFSKLGIFKTVVIGFFFQFVSAGVMVVLNLVDLQSLGVGAAAFAFGWAILYGLSVFMYTSGPSVIIQTLFGMKDFGETVGIFNIFFASGFALGSFIFTIFAQQSWLLAWGSVLAYVVVGYLLMLINIKKLQHLNLANE